MYVQIVLMMGNKKLRAARKLDDKNAAALPARQQTKALLVSEF